jgi:hypothetical protein
MIDMNYNNPIERNKYFKKEMMKWYLVLVKVILFVGKQNIIF